MTTAQAVELLINKPPTNNKYSITGSAMAQVIQDIPDDMIDPAAVEECVNGAL